MFSKISLGRYYPAHSFLHETDPRVKTILYAIYLVAIFIIQEPVAIGILGGIIILQLILANDDGPCVDAHVQQGLVRKSGICSIAKSRQTLVGITRVVRVEARQDRMTGLPGAGSRKCSAVADFCRNDDRRVIPKGIGYEAHHRPSFACRVVDHS